MRILILAALVIVTGCEYPGVSRNVEGELPNWFLGEGPARAAGTPAAPPTPPAGQAPRQAVVVRAGPVEIKFIEYELRPNRLIVPPGEISFVLRNIGRFTHDFRVEGQGVDVRTPKFAPETTQRAQVTLKPGEYQISCPLSNHAERGMVGTLIVQGP